MKSKIRCFGLWLALFIGCVSAAEKPETFVQMGHIKRINAVVFSPDAKYAISGSWDATLKLWDVASGREVRTYYGKEKVSAIALSPDGQYVLSADEGQRENLQLWDVTTGKKIRTFSGHEGGMEAITSVAFMPDGKRAVSAGGSDHILKLWDLESGDELRTYSTENNDMAQFTAVAISPDGKYLIAGSRYNGQVEMPDGTFANARSTDSTIVIWDIATGERIKAFNAGLGWVQALAVSPDGKYLISGDFEDQARMWEIATGLQIKVLGEDRVSAIAFSPDGKFALLGGSMDIRLWDIENNREIKKFSGHDGWIRSVAFSPDGKYALSGSDDSSPRLWDIASGAVAWNFGGNARQVASVAASADGKKLLVGQEAGLLNLWDTSSGRQIKAVKHTLGVRAGIISRDGALAAAGGWDFEQGVSTVKIWSTASGIETASLEKSGEYAWAKPVAISSDNKQLFWSAGRSLMLSDIATGKIVRTYHGHRAEIKDAAISSDGGYALTNDDMKIILWSVATGKALKTFDFGDSAAMVGAFSPDAENVVLMVPDYQAGKYALKTWNISANREVSATMLQYAPKGYIDSLALSHDGKFALWSESMSLYLCEIASGKVLRNFSGHMNRISSIGISSDDKTLYSASYDGTTRLWDIATGKEMVQFISFTDGEWIVMTPDGYYTGSDKADKYVNVRIGNKVYGIDQYREKFYRPEVVMAVLAGKPIADLITLASVKPAPAVSIVETPVAVDGDEITVKVKVIDAGGGIGDVRLYLNGSAVMLDSSRNLAVTEARNEAQVFSYRVRLAAGKNSLRAVSFNAGNSMQSTDALHVIEASFAAKTPALYALVIGIQEYDNPKLTLRYPVGDAKLMAATLKEQAAGLFENVNVVELTSKVQTSKEAITQALLEISSKVRPDDLFVFFVASHGTVDDGEYFLITSNVGATSSHLLKRTAFSQNDLKALIANVPSTKKLVFIDTCNAGKLGEAIQMAMLTRGMDEDTALKILSRAVGSTILSASNSLQEALEGYKDHGLFTYVVAAGLKGAADSDKDGYVKTYELVDYVDSQVPELAEQVFRHKQYPTTSLSGQGFPVGRVK